MGATYEQDEAMDREYPVHEVSLSSFKICRYEVTQELWEAVMGSNPSRNRGAKRPVDNVSWNDCQSFIKKLNSLTGKNYRLPTEAEWEFAARGGGLVAETDWSYNYSGSNKIDSVCWDYINSSKKSHQVGLKSPNRLGLYDMSGNVAEWCHDFYHYISPTEETNPTGPLHGNFKVFRGGSFTSPSEDCTVSKRDYTEPDSTFKDIGFRVVRTVKN